jgi:hypothetical protein
MGLLLPQNRNDKLQWLRHCAPLQTLLSLVAKSLSLSCSYNFTGNFSATQPTADGFFEGVDRLSLSLSEVGDALWCGKVFSIGSKGSAHEMRGVKCRGNV